MRRPLTGTVTLVVVAGLAGSCGGTIYVQSGGDGGGRDGTTSCGAAGEPCCYGTACNNGLTCRGGTCATVSNPGCGVSGEPCCYGAACDNGLMCNGGRCTAVTNDGGSCGGRGEPCCGGMTCNAGLMCSAGTCTAASDDGGVDVAVSDTGLSSCDAGAITLLASSWNMIDDESPTESGPDVGVDGASRIHIRDDAKSCGGYGAVRSLVSWDLSPLSRQVLTGSATVSFTYSYDWGYPGSSRWVAVHQVTGAWDTSTSWNTSPAWNGTPWSTTLMPPTVGEVVSFSAPLAAIQGWIDSPSTNHGILVKFLHEDCPMPRWGAELGDSCSTGGSVCTMTNPPRLILCP